MKFIKLFSLIMLLTSMITFGQQKTKTDLSMYPKVKTGYIQKIITLNKLPNEDNYNIELFIGKNSYVDTCNNHFLLGNFEEKVVDGWGYNYYAFESDGEIAGTLMGCADNKKVNKLVYAQTIKINYNSKQPIVVYLPKDYSLEYRIWEANDKLILVK